MCVACTPVCAPTCAWWVCTGVSGWYVHTWWVCTSVSVWYVCESIRVARGPPCISYCITDTKYHQQRVPTIHSCHKLPERSTR